MKKIICVMVLGLLVFTLLINDRIYVPLENEAENGILVGEGSHTFYYDTETGEVYDAEIFGIEDIIGKKG